MPKEHILILNLNQLTQPPVFEACLKQLSPRRRECVERHSMETGRIQSLGAGLILNEILEHFGLDPMGTVLEYGEYQKPYIPHHPELHFNLTHSGSYAGGAWADKPVGIDIEQIGTMRKGVARRFFHKGELRWLESLPTEAEQIQGFFRLWVLKESFMKVTGLGMKLPLNAFEILIKKDGVQVNHTLNDSTYHFQEFQLEGSRGAVCTQDPQAAEWGIGQISLR